MYPYQQTQSNHDNQQRALRQRMRNGTGAAKLIQAEDAPTHYLDSLQRFRKDFAQYDKQQRQASKSKRQMQLERKRLQQLQRENRRWQTFQQHNDKLTARSQANTYQQQIGAKRTANSSSLAYNPINLSYDNNQQGMKLKRLDEDAMIRKYVRAKNIQDRGNSKYNPINGEQRELVERVVPGELAERYEYKLGQHYDSLSLRKHSLSVSNNSQYSNNFNVSNQRYF